jgi:anti-sigma regulatory factor (Ser/Thr protein kinase)
LTDSGEGNNGVMSCCTAERGPPPERVSLRLPQRPEATSAARHGLGGLACHVERGLLEDLKLLVTELVANSVRHGPLAGAAEVALDVRVSPERVRVEVSDPGNGFEPHERTRGRDEAGGWGLFLVDRLSDRWGVAGNGHTLVWLEIDRLRGPS